jgi:hypothetical protein
MKIQRKQQQCTMRSARAPEMQAGRPVGADVEVAGEIADETHVAGDPLQAGSSWQLS